jgi:fumarate hydratase class II
MMIRRSRSEPVWSIPPGNVNPTRCEARVMVSIRVIGEDDAVALASGEAEFELDAMMPVTSCGARGTDELLGRSLILVAPLRPDVGYDKQFDAIIDRQEMVDPGVAGI